MSDAALIRLAERAGIAPKWRDAFGDDHEVGPDTLRAVLAAIGFPGGSDAEIAESEARLDEQESGKTLPPLITGRVGEPVVLAGLRGRFRLALEDGQVLEGEAGADGQLPPVNIPGYHRLEIGSQSATLAIAPPRCPSIAEVTGQAKAWGLAVQLYGLRRRGDGGIGDFAALADFVRSAARHGASAVAISPVHAQFSADAERFSPYAPSSRAMLNVLHTPLPDDVANETFARLEGLELVDWPEASRARLAAFRAAFERGAAADPALQAFRTTRGGALEQHARFEALHRHLFAADPGHWNWRDWPEAFRHPDGPEVARFAQEHAREVAFHAWLQFMADRALAGAQEAARQAGMGIGLISDLAVGADGGGSQGWSRQAEMLTGMSIGAPPDLLSPQGQSWGLVGFSPTGLRRSGFSAFIEMIRAALAHAGGLRIDHAMGLTRLWVLPDGATAAEGAYLGFPEQDLLRLVALEAHRHRAIVLGEDLGTVPKGFNKRLTDAGVMGMRVLWFEKTEEGAFTPPAAWTPDAVAMTSTHDIPTVAGWWTATDLDRRAALGLVHDEAAERAERDTDRQAIWAAFQDSGAATGEPPVPGEPEPVVDAAVRHVGGAACAFVLLPMEDAIGQTEQPNLPGTLDEHPNWRRRMPDVASRVLDDQATAARLQSLDTARKKTR